MMSETEMSTHTWVAIGSAGAIGSIRRTEQGYEVRLLTADEVRGVYPSLDVAKNSLQSARQAQGEPLEFREH
jgi:hypothetical protein